MTTFGSAPTLAAINDPDSSIVERLQAGEDAALDDLMQRYKRPVLNFAYRMLGDAGDAEDVAQETFVRVYRNIGSYRPRAKFSSWLFALARNACLDRLRYRQRHPTESLANAPEPAMQSRDVEAREAGEEIAAAVSELPEEQREVVVLAEYHDMSYAEIAGIVRCSEKAVERRLYRAKQTLREKLKHLL